MIKTTSLRARLARRRCAKLAAANGPTQNPPLQLDASLLKSVAGGTAAAPDAQASAGAHTNPYYTDNLSKKGYDH